VCALNFFREKKLGGLQKGKRLEVETVAKIIPTVDFLTLHLTHVRGSKSKKRSGCKLYTQTLDEVFVRELYWSKQSTGMYE